MRVAIVMQNEFPHVGEVRPRRVAQSLHRRGHKVTMVAWNSRHGSVVEDLDYAKVYRFGYWLNSRVYPILSSPSPLNPFWVAWILKVAREARPDIFIASNIRIALPTILAARMLRRPVILDLQENNRGLAEIRPKTHLGHYLSRNSRLVGFLERLCIRLSNHTWVVVQERLEDFPPQVLSEERTYIVSNTVDLEELRDTVKCHQGTGDTFTLIFIGRISQSFGLLEPFIRALRHVLDYDKNIRFLIGGVEGDRLPLQNFARELGVQDHVQVDGQIDPECVPSWLQQGNVGIVPYEVCRTTNTTISNKLFHYMAAGLAVMSTAMLPTRRVIEEVHCGIVIPDGSGPREIADAILRLKRAPEEVAAMGMRARQAIKEKYNWEVDFKEALRSMERLLVPAKNAADSVA